MANDPSELKLKQPDEFESMFGRFLGFLLANRTKALSLLGLLMLLAIAVYGWNWKAEQRNEIAAGKLAAIWEGFPRGSADRAEWEKFLTAIDPFLLEQAGTSVIPAAKLYKGKALLVLGRYAEAIPVFQESAKALPPPTKYLAKEGEGTALMELKRWDEAEAIWLPLSKADDNPSRETHLWRLGLTQEAASRPGPALATYEEFETTFPNSRLVEQVRSRIGALKGNPATP